MGTTPPFFRLSLELRNRIYHFALLNQRAIFTQSAVQLSVSYIQLSGVYERQAAKNLCWLLTSRRFLEEGLEQFYQHATLDRCSIVRDAKFVSQDLTLDGKTSVFELGRVRAANLSVTMGKTHVVRKDNTRYNVIVPRGKERFDSVDEDFGALGRAIVGLEACGLRELKLHVHLFRTTPGIGRLLGTGSWGGDSDGDSDEDEDDDDDEDEEYDSDDTYTESYWNRYGTNLSKPSKVSGYIADFSFLKNLGTSWEKVWIQYTPTYMERYWGDEDPVAANVLAVPIIEESLAKTAKELVGGKGWALRDSLVDESLSATVWVLDVERKGKAEKTGKLEHVGLHSYLAPCDKCRQREEKFRREPAEDGMVRFVGEDCGAVVEFETPVFFGQEGGGSIVAEQ
ncbi:hypothetical protein P171DRAFT_520288 [Karstenula rhodostoma CBS 690.94]|uniref:Uncharacterized protein n=1 Tax=Karstenula rhodostoma CBS 690.94 TaxID=1392251 RepID=A0A9P4PI66_9PLEO|nr:hypothetical protein P171DRAFT_520288 [Karstenula rhodostoma CBS 690.94]